MATSPVLPNGGQPNAPGSPDKGGKGADETKALREEIAQLKRTNSELSVSERHWAELARGRNEPEPVVEEEEDDLDADPELGDDDTPEKLVDEFSAKGIKALERRGLMTKKAAREMAEKIATKIVTEKLGQARAEMTQDQAIVGEFPELKDPESELFKATAKEFKSIVKLDPKLKDSPGALMMAARMAKLNLKPAKAADRDPDDPDFVDEDDDVDPRERRRLERVAAQSGDRGRRRTSDDGSDPDGAPVIGPETRQLLAAMKISPEDYEKSRRTHATERRRR